jgi:hypothetical protein
MISEVFFFVNDKIKIRSPNSDPVLRGSVQTIAQTVQPISGTFLWGKVSCPKGFLMPGLKSLCDHNKVTSSAAETVLEKKTLMSELSSDPLKNWIATQTPKSRPSTIIYETCSSRPYERRCYFLERNREDKQSLKATLSSFRLEFPAAI